MNPSPQATGLLPEPIPAAEAEVVGLLQDLIRIDSSNYGDGTGPGEAETAEFVASRLRDVGIDAETIECGPRRTAVVARIAGLTPDRDALLLHGHLDVVPARSRDWSIPPFAAEIATDPAVSGEAAEMVWGRGAVDMKDMDAMIIATIRAWAVEGVRPDRDIVVLFLPDEEAGGRHGSHWLVDNRPDIFRGVTEAVGEVGGFSFTVRDDLRLYLIQTAERGMAWMKLTAAGQAGHGSLPNDDNAVTALCEAVARVGRHKFPVHVTPTVRDFLAALSESTGIELNADDMDATLARLGPLARVIGASLASTANPTMLTAGYKHNVIPGEASAFIDGRFLPGYEEEFFAEIDAALGPDVVREFVEHQVALETTFDGPTIDVMAAALRAEDPSARAVPYMLFGGTDAKAFSRLGIRCFGFAPLMLPPSLDFGSLFHGVDERVPVSALRFGVRVLDRFLRAC